MHEITDQCRENLNKYTIRAFSVIPRINNPLVLDAGCGTGVPAIALTRVSGATVYAIDPDHSSMERFRQRVAELGLEQRIRLFDGSILDPPPFGTAFDIVLAEGLLNVIGFDAGLKALVSHVKHDGYLRIHDELKDDGDKRRRFAGHDLKLRDSFVLDEHVWLNEYFNCVEKKIAAIDRDGLFKDELERIRSIKSDPENLRSIYYILQYTPRKT